jgi:two-component system, NtrC family, response regulator HydG
MIVTAYASDTTAQAALDAGAWRIVPMRLPEGDGQLVRETNPQARTVVITGHRNEMESLLAEVLDAGADAVCYKPFDVQSLVETVKILSK